MNDLGYKYDNVKLGYKYNNVKIIISMILMNGKTISCIKTTLSIDTLTTKSSHIVGCTLNEKKPSNNKRKTGGS